MYNKIKYYTIKKDDSLTTIGVYIQLTIIRYTSQILYVKTSMVITKKKTRVRTIIPTIMDKIFRTKIIHLNDLIAIFLKNRSNFFLQNIKVYLSVWSTQKSPLFYKLINIFVINAFINRVKI